MVQYRSRTHQHRRGHIVLFLLLGVLFWSMPAFGRDLFVAPEGSDNSDGSLDHPYGTIDKAVNEARAGDTIFVRGGVHAYSKTIRINSSGEAGDRHASRPIRLWAYEEENPILDFQLAGSGDRGINVRGNYWHIRGITIQHAGDNGVIVYGAHNTLERLVARYNGDSGIQLHTGATENLVVNCDSYLNYDPQNNGENADGFAAKFTLGEGNTFVGCRAWSNSDDGFDFWEAGNGVTVERCWSFANGENLWDDLAFQGDGNGFKLGHGSGAHRLIGCVAFNHPTHGIDVNGNQTGVTIYNCSSVDNRGRNYYFDEHADVHLMRNNLSFGGQVLIYSEIDDEYNSWNGLTPTEEDFRSLDPNGIDGPRTSDGGLPKLPFLHLTSNSTLIDAGLDVGLAFQDSAPDVGAFELLNGDCDGNGTIDYVDLECFASTWLHIDCEACRDTDADRNGKVDWFDFAQWTGNWLK